MLDSTCFAGDAGSDSSDMALASLMRLPTAEQCQPVPNWADRCSNSLPGIDALLPQMSSVRSTLQPYPTTREQCQPASTESPHIEQQAAPNIEPTQPYIGRRLCGQFVQSEWSVQARLLPQSQPVQRYMLPAPRQQADDSQTFRSICISPSQASANDLDATCVEIDSSALNAPVQDVQDVHNMLPPPDIARNQLPLPATSWVPSERPGRPSMALSCRPEMLNARHSMSVNIEFRDAANSVLFRESLSLDYPLEEVFYLYYPTAPMSLMFYLEGNVALPKSTTLNSVFSMCNKRQTLAIIWAKIPVVANPEHAPQWS